MRTYRSKLQAPPPAPILKTQAGKPRKRQPYAMWDRGWTWASVAGTSLVVPSGVFQIWIDSARELVELHDTLAVQTHAREERMSDIVTEPKWNFGAEVTPGLLSEPGLRKLLLGGWPEGASEALALAQQVEENLPDPKAFRRLFRWREDEGEEPSFERAQAQQAPWRATYRNWRTGVGIVEIVAEWGDACNESYETIKWGGAALVALADILDRADLRTEIVLLNVCDSKACGQDNSRALTSERVVTRVQLKDAGDPLDVETVAAVTMHPGVWRTYGLAGYELTPWYLGPKRAHNHVHLDDVPETHLEGLYGNPRALTVRLQQATYDDGAIAAVERALADLAMQLTALEGAK